MTEYWEAVAYALVMGLLVGVVTERRLNRWRRRKEEVIAQIRAQQQAMHGQMRAQQLMGPPRRATIEEIQEAYDICVQMGVDAVMATPTNRQLTQPKNRA